MNSTFFTLPSNRQTKILNNQLINILDRLTKTVGTYSTPIKGLKLFRRETARKACACLYNPSIVWVCQGVKQMIIDQKIFRYDENHFLASSLDLPAFSQILEATQEKPCLGFSLNLERNIIVELIAQMEFPNHNRDKSFSVKLCNTNETLLNTISRLISLINDRKFIPILAPLIIKEIHYIIFNK